MNPAVWICLLAGATLGRKYDYTLSKAVNAWTGWERGLHYVDQFALLTERMDNIAGQQQSLLSFGADNSWSLSFDLSVTGSFDGVENGFLMILSRSEVSRDPYNPEAQSREAIQSFIPSDDGLAIFFDGKNKRELKFKLSTKKFKYKRFGTTPQSCTLPEDISKVHITLRVDGNAAVLFYSSGAKNFESMTQCGVINLPPKFLKVFFLSMFAKSSPNNLFRINVSAMEFETDLENIAIKEAPSFQVENVPRLFKTINMLASNHQLVGHNLLMMNKQDLNITIIHQNQLQIMTKFDTINHYITKNIDETDELLSYATEQEQIADQFAMGVLAKLENWVDNTAFFIDNFYKNSSDIKATIDAFDFQKQAKNGEKIIKTLEEKFKTYSKTINDFKGKYDLAFNQVKQLKISRDELKSAPAVMENMLRRFHGSSEMRMRKLIFGAIVVVGSIVIVALSIILFRLKKSMQMKVFD